MANSKQAPKTQVSFSDIMKGLTVLMSLMTAIKEAVLAMEATGGDGASKKQGAMAIIHGVLSAAGNYVNELTPGVVQFLDDAVSSTIDAFVAAYNYTKHFIHKADAIPPSA